jgi:hypothetical protein
MCFEQDVTSAFNSLTETAETTKVKKAQKALDKANQINRFLVVLAGSKLLGPRRQQEKPQEPSR